MGKPSITRSRARNKTESDTAEESEQASELQKLSSKTKKKTRKVSANQPSVTRYCVTDSEVELSQENKKRCNKNWNFLNMWTVPSTQRLHL